MAHPSLHGLFAVIVGLIAGVGSAGCSSPRIDVDDFDDHCGTPELEGLRTPAPFDSVEIRSGEIVGASFGTACATATNKTACEAERSQAKSDQSELVYGVRGSQSGAGPAILVVTAGDVVRTIDTREKLAAFLGAIDTPHEARVVATLGGFPGCRARPAGTDWEIYSTTHGGNCGSKVARLVRVDATATARITDTEVLDEGDSSCAIGRRPAGLERGAACTNANAVGAFLAGIARLEEASVVAFERFASALALHGAPAALVRSAARAAGDERKHTRMFQSLARRFGAAVERAHVRAAGVPTLEELATENAVEGCVRESYGALVATWQMQHARVPEIARAMRVIARDETRHAELSWAVARWADARLDRVARARLREARRTAVDILAREVLRPLDRDVLAATGMPSPGDACRLLDEFVASFALAA